MDNSPTSYAILNGELLPADRAGFNVANQSLVDSFGIYETIKLEEGRFFHLDWHLRRLGDSARILNLDLPASLEEIGDWCRQLAGTSTGFGLLRIVAYGSDGVHGPQCGIYMKPQPKLAGALFDPGVWLVSKRGRAHLAAGQVHQLPGASAGPLQGTEGRRVRGADRGPPRPHHRGQHL